jgi:hypothetical protein
MTIHMKTQKLITPEEIREAAVILAKYAVQDENGKNRNVDDPIHDWVTEGRRKKNEIRKKKGSPEVNYSSCGDLAHWLLYRLGNREKFLNRNEAFGCWKIGVNLSRLYWSNYFIKFKKDQKEEPEIGDIIYLNKPDHVEILLEKKEDVWIVAAYGQPYAKLLERKITKKNGLIFVGNRQLAGFINITKIYLEKDAELPVLAYPYDLYS